MDSQITRSQNYFVIDYTTIIINIHDECDVYAYVYAISQNSIAIHPIIFASKVRIRDPLIVLHNTPQCNKCSNKRNPGTIPLSANRLTRNATPTPRRACSISTNCPIPASHSPSTQHDIRG